MVAKWDQSFVVLGDVLGDVFPRNGITGASGFCDEVKGFTGPGLLLLKD